MSKFSFSSLHNLNFEDQKIYIQKFFIPLTTGGHIMINDDNFINYDNSTLNSVYFNRFDDKIKKFYTKEFTGIKEPIYKLNAPIFSDKEDTINLCPPLPIAKQYNTFNNIIKSKVKVFLDYMKEILCNDDELVYIHLIKWLSCLCKGVKNDSAIVLKSGLKGVGKSTLHTFLMNYVLNQKLCLEGGSEPLKSKFNNILGGKLLVVFEELETFTKSEWGAVDSVLKRQITSDKICLQRKGEEAFFTDNLNNYMLLSNHDICDDDRRFFVLDVQTHRIGDIAYWDNLRRTCFNKEVGEAFYSYLCEFDTTGYKAQNYPTTNRKLNSISKRLDLVYKFLKEKYLLTKKPIKHKIKELFEEYKLYCSSLNKLCCNNTDFNSKLEEIQIKHYKSNGFNKYMVSVQSLQEIAEKHKWLNELDEIQEAVSGEDDIEYVSLQEENEKLKEEIRALKQLLESKDDKELTTQEIDDLLFG